MQLRVEPDGTVRCLYAEMIELSVIGPLSIRRASHVEPDAAGKWWADLSPVRRPDPWARSSCGRRRWTPSRPGWRPTGASAAHALDAPSAMT